VAQGRGWRLSLKDVEGWGMKGFARPGTFEGMGAHSSVLARLVLVAVLLALPVVTPRPAGAQNFGRPQEEHFRIVSSAGQARGGKPVVGGYVYNDYGHYAAGVRLVVEQLDGGGRVASSTAAWVGGVPNMGRTYFEVPLAAAPGSYRVRITAFEWVQGNGGDFP